jgi:hypothetical protein
MFTRSREESDQPGKHPADSARVGFSGAQRRLDFFQWAARKYRKIWDEG